MERRKRAKRAKGAKRGKISVDLLIKKPLYLNEGAFMALKKRPTKFKIKKPEKKEAVKKETPSEKPEVKEEKVHSEPQLLNSAVPEHGEEKSESEKPADEAISHPEHIFTPEHLTAAPEEKKEELEEVEKALDEKEETPLSGHVEPVTESEPAKVEDKPEEKPQEDNEKIAEEVDPDIPEEILQKERKSKKLLSIVLLVILLILLLGSGVFFFQNYSVMIIPKVATPTPTPTQVVPDITVTPTPEVVEKSAYPIKILNGSGIIGEAARFESSLEEEGYEVSTIGNAPAGFYTETIIQAKKDVKKAFIEDLENKLSETNVVGEQEVLPETETVDVVVIIGSKKAE